MEAFLLLADGTKFHGRSCGASGLTIGEVVFNTGITGYQEVLTDPSYYGQIVNMTYPLQGNYGTNHIDMESTRAWVKGFIIRNLAKEPSNFRQEGSLNAFLKAQNIIGLEGIDTRHLTRTLREKGVMNGAIYSGNAPMDEEALLTQIRDYKIVAPLQSVTVGEQEIYTPDHPRFLVGLYDYGYKKNICRSLMKRDCKVIILPADTPAKEALNLGLDGLMFSNGPGDPAENEKIIAEAGKLLKSGLPIFGICLGHQILSLATGAKSEKLKYGHRGANHPVKDLKQDRSYITSQNHGYAIIADSIPQGIGELSHINLNDRSVEGIRYLNYPAFTVQFHPEASPGPQDTAYLFDDFIKLMEVESHA